MKRALALTRSLPRLGGINRHFVGIFKPREPVRPVKDTARSDGLRRAEIFRLNRHPALFIPFDSVRAAAIPHLFDNHVANQKLHDFVPFLLSPHAKEATAERTAHRYDLQPTVVYKNMRRAKPPLARLYEIYGTRTPIRRCGPDART